MENRFDLQCDCGDTRDHLVTFQFFDEKEWNDTVAVNAALNHYLPWYKRLIIGIEYILGIDNTFIHYVETSVSREKVEKLRDWLDEISKKMI